MQQNNQTESVNREKILLLPPIMIGCKMQIKWNSKISGIYVWFNEIDEKMYVGRAVNLYKRVYDEMNGFQNNKHQNMFKLFNAVKKYGIENFRVLKLEECAKENLNDLEKYYIKYYDTKYNGYNITFGGDGTHGHVVSEEQIKKQREALRKYYTDDKKHEQSEKMKVWFNARPKEEQDKMKTGNGWWLDDEYKRKHLENTRKSLTPDRIERQRKSLIKYYEEHDSKKMIVIEIMSPGNELVKIEGLKRFCNKYHVGFDKISAVINGKVNYFKGWHLPTSANFVPKYEYVMDNNDVIYKFTSITKFCSDNNIDKGYLRKVLRGSAKQCGKFKQCIENNLTL